MISIELKKNLSFHCVSLFTAFFSLHLSVPFFLSAFAYCVKKKFQLLSFKLNLCCIMLKSTRTGEKTSTFIYCFAIALIEELQMSQCEYNCFVHWNIKREFSKRYEWDINKRERKDVRKVGRNSISILTLFSASIRGKIALVAKTFFSSLFFDQIFFRLQLIGQDFEQTTFSLSQFDSLL